MDGLKSLWTTLNVPDIYNNLIASLMFLVIGAASAWTAKSGRFVLKWLRMGLTARLCGQQVLWALAFYFCRAVPFQPLVFIVLGVFMLGSTILTLRAFTRLGIIDAHDKTKDGVDFKASLDMARTSIDFLGIGADKLTSLPTFEEAMKRCATGGNQVRFLLSPPGNLALERAAKRNGSDVADYGRKVADSLRRIARIQRQGDLDIVVKQYAAEHDKDLQQFRLMFIDNTYCLASWTVWGPHVGTENPQLILKRPTREFPQNSAYKAFHDYFETVWDSPDSKLVDLSIL